MCQDDATVISSALIFAINLMEYGRGRNFCQIWIIVEELLMKWDPGPSSAITYRKFIMLYEKFSFCY